MARKPKKLTVGVIEKEARKIDTMKAVTVLVGKGPQKTSYSIDVFKYFSQMRLSQIFEEVVKYFVHLLDSDLSTEELDGVSAGAQGYLSLMILDKMTDLEIPADIASRLATASRMIDLDLFNQVFDHFDEEDTKESMDKLTLAVEQMSQAVDSNYVDLMEEIQRQRETLDSIPDVEDDEELEIEEQTEIHKADIVAFPKGDSDGKPQ